MRECKREAEERLHAIRCELVRLVNEVSEDEYSLEAATVLAAISPVTIELMRAIKRIQAMEA